jgi:hypothetical protein
MKQDAAQETDPKDEVAALKAEIAEAKAMMEQMAAVMLEARALAGNTAQNPGGLSDRQMLSELVAGIAKMSDPANQRNIVSPEEMSRRQDSFDEMVRLLVDAHARGEMPVYTLKGKVYLSGMLIEPQYRDQITKRMVNQAINWQQIPNEDMVPVNEVAKKIFEAFQGYIGGKTEHRHTVAGFVLDGSQILKAHVDDGPDISNMRPLDPRFNGSFDPSMAQFTNTGVKSETVHNIGPTARLA